MKKHYYFSLCRFLLALFFLTAIQPPFSEAFGQIFDECDPGIITGQNQLCDNGSTYPFTIERATAPGEWSSLDTLIASVDANGLVTPKGAGSTKIRYTIPSTCDLNGFEFTEMDVSVISAGTISAPDLVCRGYSVSHVAQNATPGGVWASSDTDIALFDVSGRLVARSGGQTTITYTVTVGNCVVSSAHLLTVSNGSAGTINVADEICFVAGDAPVQITSTPANSGGFWNGASNVGNIDNKSGQLTVRGPGEIAIGFTIYSPCYGVSSKIVSVKYLAALAGPSSICLDENAQTAQIDLQNSTTGGVWASSNPSVATIDQNGLVTKVAPGVTSISYSLPAFGRSVSKDFTVYSAGTMAGPATVCLGATQKYTVSGATAGGTWETSDTKVATVDSDGNLTVLKGGNVKLMYYFDTPTCARISSFVDVTALGEVTIEGPNCAAASVTAQLNATNSPGGGTWSSSKPEVATVDQTGLVTKVSPGSTTISYTSLSCGLSGSKEFTVYSAGEITGPTTVGAVTLQKYVATNATTGGSWASSNTEVATVDSEGNVTVRTGGSFTISYFFETEECGRISSEINVQATSGGITGAETLCDTNTNHYQYELVNLPSGGTWSVGDEYYGKIDQNGRFTALRFGRVSIFYTPPGSAVSAEKNVEVLVGIALEGPRNGCLEDRNTQFYGPDIPGRWFSSNTAVATVNRDGEVRMRTAGATVISFQFFLPECGEVTLSSAFTVNDEIEGIEYQNGEQVLKTGVNPIIEDYCIQIGTIELSDCCGSYNFLSASSEISGAGVTEYRVTGLDEPATLVLFYNQADFDFFNTMSAIKLPTGPDDKTGIVNLRIRHVSDNDHIFPEEIVRPTSVIWNESMLRWEVKFNIEHFSQFYLHAVEGSLPVTLASFDAAKQENAVALSWSTTMETNSEGFEIEHSMNGKQWQKLAVVAAEGESSSRQDYSYLHKDPSGGNNFYRLKMVDLDKTFTYSRIRNVNFDQLAEASIFPNPVFNYLQIKTTEWDKVTKVKIYNIAGITVYNSAQSGLSKSIDVKSLPAGAYVTELTLKDGQRKTFKIVVAK